MTREDEDDRAPQRESWGRQLQWILDQKGITHRGFADLLGWTNHTRLYAYLEGRTEPKPELVFEMERVLEVPGGTLSIHLGYVPPGARAAKVESLEEHIKVDPTLPDWGRRLLLYAVEEIHNSRIGRKRS